MFAIVYLGDIFSKYRTISCTNNQCSYQNVDPQPCLFMVTSGAEHKAGRQVWAGLGHGSQRQLVVHYITARGRVQWIKIWGTNFDELEQLNSLNTIILFAHASKVESDTSVLVFKMTETCLLLRDRKPEEAPKYKTWVESHIKTPYHCLKRPS